MTQGGRRLDSSHLTTCFKENRFIAEVTQKELEVIEQHQMRLSLGDLVQIWFPMHGERLRQVIDWILDQGAVLSGQKQSELKELFGSFLKPLFHEPDFGEAMRRSSTVTFPDCLIGPG